MSVHKKLWCGALVAVTIIGIALLNIYSRDKYWPYDGGHRPAVMQWFDENVDSPSSIEIVTWHESVGEQPSGLTKIKVRISRLTGWWGVLGRDRERYQFMINRDGEIVQSKKTCR